MSAAIDRTGQRFGLLTVITLASPAADGKRRWICRCDCGNDTTVRVANLRRTISCGCELRRAIVTHGRARTPEYIVWESMLARCRNPNRPRFHLYGGRGIKVCERWQDFGNFFADMGARPAPEYTIERDDSNRGYEPGNCRWATRTEQVRHLRRARNNTSGVTGVTWDRNRRKWVAWIKDERQTRYLGGFADIESAAAVRKAAEKSLGFHPQHGAA